MSVVMLEPQDVREQVSVRSRTASAGRRWLRAHRASLAILLPLLGLAAAVHLIGSAHYPRYVDDPGTYLSQAWAVRYEGELSPYSYFYDHAPAGWIQIALWAALTNGFDRYDSVIAFGTECMLLARLASTALTFALGRRLGLDRASAAVAAALLAFSPLAVVYGRWTFLDSIAMPWLLAAFTLALSHRRSIAAATGACAGFAMAALSKETFLVFLPAFGWLLARNLDRRNRAQVLLVSVFTGVLLMALYPLMALYKGELFPGPGHNSLLLLGGAAAAAIALARRELWPIVLALATGWLLMIRGGYVPFMHVITMLPFCAILIAAVPGILARAVPVLNRSGPDLAGGTPGFSRSRPLIAGGTPGFSRSGPDLAGGTPGFSRSRPLLAGGMAAILLVGAMTVWLPRLREITGPHEVQPLRAATLWAARNIPRDKQLVVHDTIWTDLVHHYGFQPRPVIAHKLDTDPAVRRAVKRIDYLIVPDWYYGGQSDAIPTLAEARKHAMPVATFGSGDNGVKVYRVSTHWTPPT